MIEIDFGGYLSEEERKEIVEREFRSAVARSIQTSNDVERFIGNVAYLAVESLVDEILGLDKDATRKLVAEKAATVIRNLDAYTVFQTGYSILRRQPSVAQRLLDEAVKDNQDMIAKRVKRIINEAGREDVRSAFVEAINNTFSDQKEAQK